MEWMLGSRKAWKRVTETGSRMVMTMETMMEGKMDSMKGAKMGTRTETRRAMTTVETMDSRKGTRMDLMTVRKMEKWSALMSA